jgi:hypothetical protein
MDGWTDGCVYSYVREKERRKEGGVGSVGGGGGGLGIGECLASMETKSSHNVSFNGYPILA